MKCPYGTQHWNHFLKATTKQNQYKLHLIQFVEKNKGLTWKWEYELC